MCIFFNSLYTHCTLRSWTCIRIQTLEQTVESIEPSSIQTRTSINQEWCQGADDWDDNNANINEENGNVVSNVERTSDEDDESCSIEEVIRMGLGNLTVDDRNANMGMVAEAQGKICLLLFISNNVKHNKTIQYR